MTRSTPPSLPRGSRGIRIPVVFAWLALFLWCLSPAEAQSLSDLKVGDTVKLVLRGGGRLEGEVIEVSERILVVKHRYGRQEVEKIDIESWEKFQSNEEIFEEKAAACKTADDWCELGKWAQSIGEEALALRAYERATEIDPDNALARKALGQEKYEGEWLDRDEVMRRKGFEFYDGEWRTPEEIAALKKEAAREAADARLKGQRELEKEYIGRPWGDVRPVITENYRVWCNSTDEVARYYADVMESLYRTYDRVFRKRFFPRLHQPPTPDGKCTVWIHSSHRQFMDLTGNGPGTGGFYRFGPMDVTAYHGSFGSTGSTEEVLAHEGTHQFQGMIFKEMRSVPIWIIEGLAVYFGDGTEIERRNVELNVIPRDRLATLQAAIEEGSYIPLKRLLRTPHFQFSGFHYSHAWGVIYWCIYGNQMNNGWRGTIGVDIMNDWLSYIRDLDGPADYERDANKFEQLLTSHSKLSLEEWEEKYKQWILGLPLEPLGDTRSGGRWISEKLGLEIKRPVGWSWVKESQLNRGEVVASRSGSREKEKRIATSAWPNWMHAELSEALVRQTLESFFSNVEFEEGREPQKTDAYSYEAWETEFTAQRKVAETGTVGGDGGGGGAEGAAPAAGPRLRFRVVVYGSPDKIYANLLEAPDDIWEDAEQSFGKYLEDFRIIFK